MTTSSQSPSWLAKRTSKRPTTSPSPPADPDTTSTTKAAPTKPNALLASTRRLPIAATLNSTGQAAASSPEKAGNPSRRKTRPSRSDDLLALVQADLPAVMDRLVAQSSRPEVAELLRADLEGALRAMIASAYVAGPAGMGERANLFKLAGLPLDRPKGDGAASKDRLASIAERLERAAGMRAKMVEAARAADFGHGSGTGEGAASAEAPESLRFDA